MLALSSTVDNSQKTDGVRALKHVKYRSGVWVHYTSDGVLTLCGLRCTSMVEALPIWDECTRCVQSIQKLNDEKDIGK